MKSCRTPSMLTEYSSVNPGRLKRTVWPQTDTSPAPDNGMLDSGDGELKVALAVVRPTAIAVTRKRSFIVLVTVEVNHKPSGVASPSSRWNTQCRRASDLVGVTASPSPW